MPLHSSMGDTVSLVFKTNKIHTDAYSPLLSTMLPPNEAGIWVHPRNPEAGGRGECQQPWGLPSWRVEGRAWGRRGRWVHGGTQVSSLS